jgi:GTP-binding protein
VDIGGEDPQAAYASVRGELAEYGGGLERLPELVVLSKADLVPDGDSAAAAEEWARRLGLESLGVLAVSSISGAGIENLRRAILTAAPAPATERERGRADDRPAFEADYMTYRPAGDQGFDVERVGEGTFEVRGRGIELLVRRHDIDNPEALAYLEQRLNEIGVIAALRSAGFEPGDEVRIAERAFELDPAS